MHRARLTTADGQRHAGLQASYEWFEATIFDLGVSTFLLEYDGEEEAKADVLRALALVVRAYLRGEGRVEHRRGLLRSRTVFRIVIDNRQWELGRRSVDSLPVRLRPRWKDQYRAQAVPAGVPA